MDNLFNGILGKDEEIIKIIKPSKKKTILGGLFRLLIMLLFLAIVLIPLIVTITVFYKNGDSELQDHFLKSMIPVISFVGLIFLIMVIILVIYPLISYRNLYYCYTNKRLIIRSGIFGIDFNDLNMNHVGGAAVKVSFIDRMLKPATGSIIFASISGSNQKSASFSFLNVENPYELYQIIKEYIDKHKNAIIDGNVL